MSYLKGVRLIGKLDRSKTNQRLKEKYHVITNERGNVMIGIVCLTFTNTNNF